MTENYAPYLLKENPFPSVAIVDPRKRDIRVNGLIFQENVMREEVESLREKIEKKTSMIYVAGLKFDKGIGKSALIVHEWRRLSNLSNSTSVLVRCNPKNKPADLALLIAVQWHEQCYLWKATHRLLTMFAQAREDVRVSKDAIETMFGAYPTPPERLPLTLYTHVTSPERFVKIFVEWLSSLGNELNSLFLEEFFKLYLTKPAELPERVSKFRIHGLDAIETYANLLGILCEGGFENNFIFVDQLEDAIMPTPAGKIGEFCLDLKRMLEAGIGKTVIVVTLHPDSEMKLDTQAAQHLLKVAPLDAAHRVDVLSLEVTGNSLLELATEYMNHFRTGTPSYPTFPIQSDVIRYISFLAEGNMRSILQQLHECLKYGASNGNPEISLDCVLEHHKETIGTLKNPGLYDEFRAKVRAL
jgi:hypothetical protein